MGLFTNTPPPQVDPRMGPGGLGLPQSTPGAFGPTQGPVLGAPVSDEQLAAKGLGPPVSPPQAEVPSFPGIPDQTQGGMDETSGIGASLMGLDAATPLLGGPRAPGAQVMPAYDDYQRVGGTDPWKDAFVTKPAQLESAINQGAQAEEDLGKARADFYKNRQATDSEQLAILQDRRNQHQAQIEAQQAQLMDATKRYSDDLSDRGQYWHNPGSILASMGAIMISMASPNDPSIGLRLIDQAVNADFQKRRAIADTNLGELRSNLSAYRQIMGDKDLGDRLAYAESQRVAAMELERISGQFQGPIAKAKAAAVSKELLRNYQVQMMQLHSAQVFHQESVQSPQMAAEIKKRGAANPGEGPTSLNGTPFKSGPVVAPTAFANFKASSYGGSSGSSATGSDILSPQQTEDLEKRSPGSSKQLLMERASIVKEMLADSGVVDVNAYHPGMSNADLEKLVGMYPGAKEKFNKNMIAFRKYAAEDTKNIQQAAQPLIGRISSYKQLGGEMQLLETTARQLGMKSPEELLNQRPAQILGAGNIKAWNEFLNASDPSTDHEAQAKSLAQAVSNFKQSQQGNIIEYIHTHFGSALSPGEKANLDQMVASDHSFGSLKHFYQMGSKAAQEELSTATSGTKHPLTGTLWRVNHGMGTPGMSVGGVEGPDTTSAMQVGNTGKVGPAAIKAATENLRRKSLPQETFQP